MKTYIITGYGVKPNEEKLQNAEFQAILDMCRNGGGRVVVPEGTYRISSIRLWSDTELYLESGAKIIGSEDCRDYILWDVPENFEFFTDSEAFTYLRPNNSKAPETYRCAIITAYGESNISIIGEENSLIDGMDCCDTTGEEGFRGPHGIFLSSCKNVTLKGYTIQNSGNFMHQLDNCENVLMENLVVLGGHDGAHLHRCKHLKITNCTFRTGDDCIAGCDMLDVTVSDCSLNTSCNVFRIGGSDLLIEKNRIEGPGYYPHRISLGRDKGDRTKGRHNTLSFIHYFASEVLTNPVPAHNIVIRDCVVKNVEELFNYRCNTRPHQSGIPLSGICFENIDATGVDKSCTIWGEEKYPVEVVFENVKVSYADGEDKPPYDKNVAKFVNFIEY